MATVLFVGAGRHQRRAIERIGSLGVRVVAVDRNEGAPGLAVADVPEVVDFADVSAVVEAARRHHVDGVLTVAADRAVPVVAAVAEALGLPGIGSETAHRMTHKHAMREALGSAGVPQPTFAAAQAGEDLAEAAASVGFPAVVKPVDSSGQRGLFRVEEPSGLDDALGKALAESASGEVLVEELVSGIELNTIVIARGGRPELITISDRVRPSGIGFGVAIDHLYPTSVDGRQLGRAQSVALDSVRALGMRDGIAYPQLLAADDGRVVVVEVAARIPGGQMADLVRYGVGVDLVEVALLQALGKPVPDDVALPRYSQPLAIRFLTAEPGPLPTGRVVRVGGLDPVLACDGVVQADSYLELGETIRPVQRDGDRRGYVIALADTTQKARQRAEAAASLLEVEVVR